MNAAAWLGGLPQEWNSRRVKTLTPVLRGASPRPIDDPIYFDDDGEYAWVRISDVTGSDGLLLETTQRLSAIGSSRSVKLEPGELFLSIAGSVGKPCITGIRACIHDGFVYFPRLPKASQRFLYYIFESGKCFSGLGKLGTQLNLNTSSVGDIEIPFPSMETQKAITDFLDAETARIDQLIKKKMRFVPLLKEKREAVIAHAVTEGINQKAPKRESGEAWLGMMPTHWQVVPPTALFTESKERVREGDQMLSATQKYGVIPLAQFEELEQRQVTMALVHLDKRKHVEVGDFVISMRSMDGGLERARAVGSVRSSYSVLKAGPDVDGRFYGALLKSSLYIQALRQTANFIRDGQDMNFSHFRKVRLPKLPVAEQSEIADYIEAETDRIDALVGLTERSIERLREYRVAIITAAVTGQIDLANWNRASTPSRQGSPA